MQSLIRHGEWGMDADDVDSDDERGRGGDEEAGPVMAVGKRRSSVFDPDGGGGADGEMSGMKKWAAHEDVGLSAHEKEAISGIFKSVDTDGSGTIDQGELVTCLEQIGIDPSQDELDQIFAMAGQPKTNNKLAGGDGATGSEGAEGGAAAAEGAGGEDSRALSLQDLLNVVSRLRADQAAAPPDQSSSGGASGGGGGGLLGKLIFWKSKEKDDDELKPDELKALQVCTVSKRLFADNVFLFAFKRLCAPIVIQLTRLAFSGLAYSGYSTPSTWMAAVPSTRRSCGSCLRKWA
jgi:hypothetical protein